MIWATTMSAGFPKRGACSFTNSWLCTVSMAVLAAIMAFVAIVWLGIFHSCLVRRYWLRTAFAVWASRSLPAERLPASLASMNWKTSSNVLVLVSQKV